jgi:hypothetical protein
VLNDKFAARNAADARHGPVRGRPQVMATFFQGLNLDSLELIKIVDYQEFLKRKE